MLYRNATRFRLRPSTPLVHHRLASHRSAPSEPAIFRRLADRTHRSNHASLERETRLHRRENAEIKLNPSLEHFLLWLRRKRECKLDRTTLKARSLPLLYKEAAAIEVLLFHILTCLNALASDGPWLASQAGQLAFLHDHLMQRRRKMKMKRGHNTLVEYTEEHALDLSQKLGFTCLKAQIAILHTALNCMSAACPSIGGIDTLVPWLKSLAAPRVTEACAELSNLTYIPACVTSDILLRTPMSVDENALQLDLWFTFMGHIAQESMEKRAHTTKVIENLVYYTVQFEPRMLERLLRSCISELTKSRSGYELRVMTPEFANSLIYALALNSIKSRNGDGAIFMPVIRAQKVLAEYLGTARLSQKGYVGITLLIAHESREKAARLLEITKAHFPAPSDLLRIAEVYLSYTPEELLHHFNVGITQHPNSATLWLLLVKKLHTLHILSEKRSQKLLAELAARKNEIVISKDLILMLLGPVDSVSGIEEFIGTLRKAGLFEHYKNVVLNKYMALLYRFSNERSVHKPYLDSLCGKGSNVECARFLYANSPWKTTSIVGTMLNGEVNHRPGEIYHLYCRELQGNLPDESCLMALLRASTKRADGKLLVWGQLYASQVAVHEFKQNVQSEERSTEMADGLESLAVGIFASNRLWQAYITALVSAEYMAELADIIRWWERIRFVPSKYTLMHLLRALPQEFRDRHIKHGNSLPQSSNSWPWPQVGDIRE